jgi:serine/threonine protein kinase
MDLTRVADYEITAPLAEGNHGAFFLARPPARLGLTDDVVVVKVMTGAHDGAHRHLVRELRAFTAAESPFLVPLFDAGQAGDVFFYSMRYFPRGSLADASASMTLGERIRAVADAAEAAHALHEIGLTHRDIRPGNILVHDGGACLADLALAIEADESAAMTTLASIDAVGYVDPAYLRGDPPSRATDVFSLGAVLHEMVTGTPIYPDLPADPLLAMRAALRSSPRIDPSVNPGPGDVLRRCLSARLEERPTTALALAEELRTLADAP